MTERHRVAPELLDKLIPVGDVETWPGNARIGDLDTLAVSLHENTQYRPIIVQKSTMKIIAGNQTYRAAKDNLGWTHVAADVIDVDDQKAREIVLMDNRASDEATYDEGLLYKLIREHLDDGGSLVATGYDDADLQVLAQVSGALGEEALDFLSDIDDEGAATWDENAQSRETGMVSLVFSFTEDDKDTVVTALKTYMEVNDECQTIGEALVQVCSEMEP